jgi:hypothetical protein
VSSLRGCFPLAGPGPLKWGSSANEGGRAALTSPPSMQSPDAASPARRLSGCVFLRRLCALSPELLLSGSNAHFSMAGAAALLRSVMYLTRLRMRT